ncbi:hypothetical protein SAMN03159376_04302 [Pseudomonas sp. NFACC09-4]|uniref:hypothetical protein n=1 Tax=unclassified Pseudomonas TaxID=196821 RepID=UPI0009091A95|nr:MULTISPECIES: hypothetical protein [unclassified Pseudomonas]SFW83168.1 hypothetical protein SAMN03159376_04302 [Pseudomonas sp. NFACC09-4]SFY22483.1 hypothetical protein SAMN03159309_04673 [Pseudomonas sp. NFACC36]
MIIEEVVHSRSRWYLMCVSYKVMRHILELRKYGSGNQTLTREAHVRTQATYEYLERKKHEPRWLAELDNEKYQGREHVPSEIGFKRYDHPTTRPKRALDVVRITGGGNCDQLGAIAYALSREILSDRYFAAWVSPTTVEHTFAIIGPMSSTDKIGVGGTQKPDEWVVVDAWPLKPRVCRFVHYFLYPELADFQWYIIAQGKGKGTDALEHTRSSRFEYFEENLKPNLGSITGKYAKNYSEVSHREDIVGQEYPWALRARDWVKYHYTRAPEEPPKRGVKRKRQAGDDPGGV